MNQVPIKLGPLALLLTVISICLTTLSILTFSTARADMRMAEKYAETVKERYELETQGQTFLRDTSDEILAGTEFFPDQDGILRQTLSLENARLEIGLRLTPGGYSVRSWRIQRQWAEDTSMGNLWPGN